MIVDDDNVYRMSNIIRYSQLDKIKNESVAEHSYYVAWFVNRVCTEFHLCSTIRLMALEAAILHDVPEVITNDITYDVKCMVPEIKELLQPYEEQIIKEHSYPVWETLFHPKSWNQRVAKAVVKHADILSVVQYCHHEEMLGNKSFTELREASQERAMKTLDELLTVIREGDERYAEKQ